MPQTRSSVVSMKETLTQQSTHFSKLFHETESLIQNNEESSSVHKHFKELCDRYTAYGELCCQYLDIESDPFVQKEYEAISNEFNVLKDKINIYMKSDEIDCDSGDSSVRPETIASASFEYDTRFKLLAIKEKKLKAELKRKHIQADIELKKRSDAIRKRREQEILRIKNLEEEELAELENNKLLLEADRAFDEASLEEAVFQTSLRDIESADQLLSSLQLSTSSELKTSCSDVRNDCIVVKNHEDIGSVTGISRTADVNNNEKDVSRSMNIGAISRNLYGMNSTDTVQINNSAEINLRTDTPNSDERKQQPYCKFNEYLPRPEVLKFDGKLENYISFLFSFDTNIDSLDIPDRKKLSYLFQFCSENVVKCIRCCVQLNPSEGYKRARQILNDLYGSPHNLARTYLDKLIKGPVIKPNDVEGLKQLCTDMIETEINMSSLKYESDLSSVNCLYKICSRLPSYLRARWADEADNISISQGRDPKFCDLRMFLQKRSRVANSMYGQCIVNNDCQGNETGRGKHVKQYVKSFMMQSNCNDEICKGVEQNIEGNNVNYVANNSGVNKQFKCSACKGNCKHVSLCPTFKGMSLAERLNLTKGSRLCYNCLSFGHVVAKCFKEKQCPVQGCKGKHNILLHSWKKGSNDNSEGGNSQGVTSLACSSMGTHNLNAKVCLNTVPVEISNNQHTISCYALLDTGSDVSLCSEKLVDMLGLQGRKISYNITTLGNQSIPKVGKEVDFKIGSIGGKFSTHLKGVWSVDNLPTAKGSIASQNEIQVYNHLSHISLPNVIYPEVMVLIGSDLPQLLTPLEIKSGKPGEPVGFLGPLGWAIMGPLNKSSTGKSNLKKCLKKQVNFITNDVLSRQVENLWKLDSVEKLTDTVAMSQEDVVALDIMRNSIVEEIGHYNIALPWKDSTKNLPNNKEMAHSRLQSLRRKLSKDKTLHEMYVKQINDYIEKGYAQRVLDSSESHTGKIWYLPHHPVSNENKPGKVRVVFDCAAEFEGVSLNSQLLQGPDYMNSLIGVLLRFRAKKVAIASDIEAMFHQVKVKEVDTDSLRFLWWPEGDLSAKPQIYKMVVHLFGAKSSPSCTSYALRQSAYDQADKYSKEVLDVIFDNFYVDDCLMSESSVGIACKKAEQVRELLSNKGFKLTKWISNNKDVIQSIPDTLRAPKVKDLSLDKGSIMDCTLGVQWGVTEDTLSFKIKIENKVNTKRGILSVVSSLFDPCGLVAPIVLPAKLLIQSLWREKLGWDDHINEETVQLWEKWKGSVQALRHLHIPRYYKAHNEENVCIRLHIFTDASEIAFGACVYLTVAFPDGNIESFLVLGKSRLAPLKVMSIPRLELKAAVLGCHLGNTVKEELRVKFETINYWTDSMLVLNYIQNKTKRFKTFIANRISEIHGFTDPEDWGYVPTKINPADHASRGISTENKEKLDEWLQGPEFIRKPLETWPKVSISSDIDPDISETKNDKRKVFHVMKENIFDKLLSTYSSWNKLNCTVVWLLRFKEFIKWKYGTKKYTLSKGPLTVNELEKASICIVELVQREHFSEEIQALSQNKQLSKSSSIKGLYPKLVDGILRVGGRLINSPIDYNSKHPIILPKRHHVTNLLIRNVHNDNGHVGVNHVLNLLRNKYWIIHGISTVRNELGRCIICKKRNQPPLKQLMGNLPEERVKPDDPPFFCTGVDYFGPITVKQSRSLVKRYGCVFTCLTTRAVHIEIAHSLNTNSFLGVLTRFIARRGKPNKIFSDNGTNFVAANHELKTLIAELNKVDLSKKLAQKGIDWYFNPPFSPFKGGVWERMIRSIKQVTSAIVREQILSDEALITLMAEVEKILNSRPITYVSSDSRDPCPLSPNMLLLIKPNDSLPPGLFDKDDNYPRRWWRQIHYLSNIFWRRWVKEYLPSLQLRQKWQTETVNLAQGDLVLLKDTSTHRGVWPLAIVKEVIKSSDGLVRSCVVKTAKSEFLRPINVLCKLEMSK